MPKDIVNIEREDKLNIMRDVLSLEFGTNFANPKTVFPAFYAQDLIIFGLENNIPEAVRLGEMMTSEIGESLSRELAMDVKNYLLENSEKYRAVMKKTGPIDNASLYLSTTQRRRRDGSGQDVPVFFNTQDPYWQEILQKNTQRQNIWKTPSFLAWNHKPRGINEELFDMKKIDEAYKLIG